MSKVSITVLGEPASKANSRALVTIRNKPAFIKSKKARDYAVAFDAQCPRLAPLMTGDVQVEMTIFYASRRSDLDESLILDLLQGKIYQNDRQVKRKIIHWALDRHNPRADITITPM